MAIWAHALVCVFGLRPRLPWGVGLRDSGALRPRASMAMVEDAMVSTADDGAGGFGRGPWRELIGLKKATALNGCKGLVVERDASADRYLF